MYINVLLLNYQDHSILVNDSQNEFGSYLTLSSSSKTPLTQNLYITNTSTKRLIAFNGVRINDTNVIATYDNRDIENLGTLISITES